MGRSPRVTEPGVVYHVLNRRVMRLPLFKKDGDYLAFEHLLSESLARPDAPYLLAWCLMPNHWHLIVRAGKRTNLSTWMQWVSVTHAHRWHAHTRTSGEGPLYQGRFKSFPVQEDEHFLTLCRYVEANPLQAKLVNKAQLWRWSSLWVRRGGQSALAPLMRPWPVDRPRNWLAAVNREMNTKLVGGVRLSLLKGMPLGNTRWTANIASRLGIESSLRPRGRPRKEPNKSYRGRNGPFGPPPAQIRT